MTMPTPGIAQLARETRRDNQTFLRSIHPQNARSVDLSVDASLTQMQREIPIDESRWSTRHIYRNVKSFLSRVTKLIYNFVVLRGNMGFIDSVEKWIDEQHYTKLVYESHPTAWHKMFTKEIELDNFDHRFRDRGEFRLFRDIKWCVSREVKIYYVAGARIIGDAATVTSPAGRVFKELTYPVNGRAWRYRDFYGRVFLPEVRFKAGWYTSLTCPTSYNFFHWIMECLPRLAVLERYIKLFDGIIIPEGSRPFHYESLRALGIDDNCLIEASSHSHLRAEHFFTTDYSARDNPPPWLHRWYKEKFIQPLGLKVKPGRKVYISRADAVRRKASNYEEIEKMVSALGFEVVTLSQLSFAEQAKVFHTSDFIVGEHGAGLANLVFCRKGTKVIEILSAFWMYPCFYAIAVSAGLEYHFFVAGAEEICPVIAERMDTRLIEHVVVDWDKSSRYRIDANELQNKILAVM
jgi:capsular polysaccharide biosynthesis protein